jgi:hypothetical protein
MESDASELDGATGVLARAIRQCAMRRCLQAIARSAGLTFFDQQRHAGAVYRRCLRGFRSPQLPLKITITVYNFRAISDLILHRFHCLATCIPAQNFWIIEAET